MAFDPRSEDYQRMGLRFARSLKGSDPFGAARQMMSFGRRFQGMRDSLPQSDEDRAFHLVAEATDILDYQLPFAGDEYVSPMLAKSEHLLEEALELDPACHDARRMLESAHHPSFESYYHFLEEEAPGVLASCERIRDAAVEQSPPADAGLAADIAMRPYIRWMFTQTTKALICGRYRQCIRLGEELLELDPSDPSDVRYTLALAYAKLEDQTGLDSLMRRTRPLSLTRRTTNPWYSLAQLSQAHKRRDRESAARIIRTMCSLFPHAAFTLYRQDELPDGVYSRLAIAPETEDELVLATSEATVLLQEGRDALGRGSLGSWIASFPTVVEAAETLRAREAEGRDGEDPAADGGPDADDTDSSRDSGERP